MTRKELETRVRRELADWASAVVPDPSGVALIAIRRRILEERKRRET